MLSLSNVKAAQAETYYERDDYYTKGDADVQSDSQWQGIGAERLHLSGEVEPQIFKQLLHGQTPSGKPLHSKAIRENHRAATDYTFSAPKSVSIAALIQKDRRVIRAHDQAVSTALSVLEQRYAQTRVRRGPGLRERVNTGNIIAATFRHETSREQDPQLHTHCVVINATQLENGKWQSLSNDDVLNNQKLLGEIYQNELAHQLRQLGYEIAPKENGVFECKGYEEPLLNLFSTRSQQIEQYIEKWEAALREKNGKPLHAKQKEQATLATRLRKKTVPRSVLLSGWETSIQSSEIHLPIVPEKAPASIENHASVAAIAGVNHASERESVFKREKVERFALEHHLGEQSFTQLQSAITTAGLLPAKHRYTTQTAIARERETIALMASGQGQAAAIADANVAAERIATEETLTPGQRQAILETAASCDQVIAWQGVAGAGKTYSLKLLTQLAVEKGYEVSGYAPSAQAANVLSEEANIESNTVASLLHSQSKVEGKANRKGALWIVDEAGLLSAKDAHALLTKAQNNNARVLLVGDTRQLSAVEAGNPFKSLQQAGIATCYLEESRRQKTAALKTSVVCLAAGEQHEGLMQLERAGMVHEAPHSPLLHQQIVRDYLSGPREQRAETLVLCGTNVERLALTAELRRALQQEGSLGRDQFTLQSLRSLDRTKAQLMYAAAYSEGEVVVPVRDYRRYGLKKSVQYRVTARDIVNNQVTVVGPQNETITFDPSRCGDKTTYAVQQIEIAPGEQLRWTRNDRTQGIRNGQLVTVTAISPDGRATLREANRDPDAAGKEITLQLSGQQCLDYALVSTTYSAQGKTAERVLAISDKTLSKEGLYVAVSRAKRQLSLYTTSKEDLYKRAERSSAKENPSDYLSLCELVKPDAANPKAARPARIVRRVSQSERLGDRIGAVVASRSAAAVRADGSAAVRDRTAESAAVSLSRESRASAAESRRVTAAACRQIERRLARRRVQRRLQEKAYPRGRGVYEQYVARLAELSQQPEPDLVARKKLNWLLAAEEALKQTRSGTISDRSAAGADAAASGNDERHDGADEMQQNAQQAEQQRYQDLYNQYANQVGGGVDVQAQDKKIARRLLLEMLRARKGKPLTPQDKASAENIMQQSPAAKGLAEAGDQEAAQAYAVSILRQAKQRILADQARQAKRAKQKERGGMER